MGGTLPGNPALAGVRSIGVSAYNPLGNSLLFGRKMGFKRALKNFPAPDFLANFNASPRRHRSHFHDFKFLALHLADGQ